MYEIKMITTPNLNQVRKEIFKLKKENPDAKIVVRAQDDNFNRKILENKDVNMLVGLEIHNKRDYMKQRDSGLNEVLCKLAKENNIKIGIDVHEITKLPKIEKARVLARIKQNIQLCKRIGCEIVLLDENKKLGKQEIMSFFVTFGGSTKMGKQVFTFYPNTL